MIVNEYSIEWYLCTLKREKGSIIRKEYLKENKMWHPSPLLLLPLPGRQGLAWPWLICFRYHSFHLTDIFYAATERNTNVPACTALLFTGSTNKVVPSSSKYIKLSKQQDCRTLSFLRENLWAQNLSSSERLEPGWCWCYLLTHTTSLKAGCCCFSQTISSSSFMKRSKKF